MTVCAATSYGIIRVAGDSVIEPSGSPHRHGDMSLLIVGHCLLDRAQRDAAFAAAVSDGDPARVAAWPGAYSAIVIQGLAVTAYADVSEQFPLFYSCRGGETLV